MAVEEQLLGGYVISFRGGVGWWRIGQTLIITDRTIFKLAFKTYKIGSPPAATITFTIRRQAAEQPIMVSKVWGTADTVPTDPTWIEVTFDTPLYVNERVFILMEWSGDIGDGDNCLAFHANTTSVKPDENVIRYYDSWTQSAAWDATYIYTYDLPTGMKGLGPGAMAQVLGV